MKVRKEVVIIADGKIPLRRDVGALGYVYPHRKKGPYEVMYLYTKAPLIGEAVMIKSDDVIQMGYVVP